MRVVSNDAKTEKLRRLMGDLEEIKNTMGELLEEYENDGASDEVMDTLTEAMDALEDAFDGISEVALGEK